MSLSTSSSAARGPATPPGAPTFRRASRPADRRLVGGVAEGLADHLSFPVLAVRIVFVVSTFFNGAGIFAYLILWRMLPLAEPEQSAGLASAERRGLRTGGRRIGPLEVLQTVAICAIGAGVLLLLQLTGRGVSGSLLLPLLVGLLGVSVIWRQLDDVAWQRWMRQTSGWAFAARIGAGVVMVALAAAYVLTQERGLGGVVDVASATGIALVGIGLILGPWITKLLSDLSTERRERVRSQERADVAAHRHDSVLQTLALLQKNADDPAAVATLARRQERDLRAWLYGDEDQHGDSLLAALRLAAAEVEEAHHVTVEVVGVGDATLDSDVAALARAAREAMVNAAKHARVGRVDVYAECDGRTAEVFVRDRGAGFDPDHVAEDRLGLRGSIVGRVERHGGTVTIRSAPGEGTEVMMSLPLRSDAPSPANEETSA
ncbi:PspC domain-containing protein [Aeromicrobium sp.]|uniref:ATP-binding protein n=1 Tax=Aeromicrobium sp. TaxID=1871063 RepID=UPI003C5AE6ED